MLHATEKEIESLSGMTVEGERLQAEGSFVAHSSDEMNPTSISERVNLRSPMQSPDDKRDKMGHKMADEQQSHRLGILHLEATMETMKEELANLEAVKKELDDQKAAKVEANQDTSDDDADLDSYSDSVEKWELKEG